eukprot:14020469-Ditylum_brightwellii.AAC.1
MDRSKQKEHLVLEQDEDVDNEAEYGDDDSVGNGDDDGADNGANGAEKHLIHLSQVADCCLAELIKQKDCLVSDEDNDVHDGNVDGDDDSVGN